MSEVVRSRGRPRKYDGNSPARRQQERNAKRIYLGDLAQKWKDLKSALKFTDFELAKHLLDNHELTCDCNSKTDLPAPEMLGDPWDRTPQQECLKLPTVSTPQKNRDLDIISNVAALLVGALFRNCQGVLLTDVKYEVDLQNYSINLQKQGVTVVTCKRPRNCQINGFKDGCLVDIQFPSDGHVEFILTDVRPDQLKLSTSNTRNGIPLFKADHKTISVEDFRNQKIQVNPGEGLLLFCRASASVGLEHPGPTYSHSSTIIYCQKEGQCEVNNKELGVESTSIPCNCDSSPGRCFYFPQLDKSRHAGSWMCRHNDTGAVVYVNLVFNDPSKRPQGGVKPSSSSSSGSREQQSILTTIATATLILWSQYKTLFD